MPGCDMSSALGSKDSPAWPAKGDASSDDNLHQGTAADPIEFETIGV